MNGNLTLGCDRMYQLITNEPIAIIGQGCRLPGANTLEELWELMINQRDAIRPVPENRWTAEQSCWTDMESRKMQAGWLKCAVDEFDGRFFGISPAELEFVDPQQRLLLEVSWEALEDALIDPLTLKGTNTGIFTGQWLIEYKELLIESGFKGKDAFRSYMGNGIGTTASRIAHFFETAGPNIATDSGCSASMVAVGLAVKCLRNKETDLALAAGTNLLILPYYIESLKHLISKDGHCKTFDETADGFGRAEGCAVLVLKRLSDAIRDQDRIYALIRGYGAAQEGTSKSMGTPTVDGEAAAMWNALQDANVHPSDVSFVEAHGTGTPVGDPLEIQAIGRVYSKGRKKPLYIGSVKSNVGHTEATSGITGILKTLLAFQKEIIPPHRALTVLNPKINLDSIPAVIPIKPQPWKKVSGQLRYAGVSSFGISGTDAHIILQEAPFENIFAYSKGFISDNINIIPLSTKTDQALTKLLAEYQKILKKSDANLTDIAYSAAVGRTHFNHRVAILGQSCENVHHNIQNGMFIRGNIDKATPKICFLFTGQGSQYHGMAKTLYDRHPVFQSNFKICDQILQKLFNVSIQNALWGTEKEKIHHSLYSQASIFVVEYCLTKLYESWSIKPDCVLGHSLGEFAAATAAGILNLHDALKLVGTRSVLIGGLPSGKMIVVKANKQELYHIIRLFLNNNEHYWLDIAAVNSPEQITLAGPETSVDAFAAFCKSSEIKTHILDAGQAFHSRDMDPILDELKKVTSTLKYSKPKCKYISGVEGCIMSELDSDYWIRHTRFGVNFKAASETAYEMSFRNFLEIGPQPVLSGLLTNNFTDIQSSETISCFSSMKRNSDECETIFQSVANLYVKGVEINWKKFHKFQKSKKTPLPAYPFQRTKSWFDPAATGKSKKTRFHPLGGVFLETPAEQMIFENFFTLNDNEYISDHKIGNHILFPASAFIEQSLSAGYAATFSRPEEFSPANFPLLVENIKILAPLELFALKTYEFQTVVNPVENRNKIDWRKVVIYSRKHRINNSWTCHSEAYFTSTPNQQLQYKKIDEIKSNMTEDTDPAMYKKLSVLGYNFGSEFQRLEKVWKNESSSSFLAEIRVPAAELGVYYCHPTVLDAMIQLCLITSLETMDSLNLPVAFKSLLWIKRSTTAINYIYVFQEIPNKEKSALLYDENGDVLASLCGVEFVKTSTERLEKALKISTQRMLPIYLEQWRKSKKSFLPVVSQCSFLGQFKENFLKTVSPTTTSDLVIAEKKNLDYFICIGIQKCFQILGWNKMEVGDRVETWKLLKKLNIKNTFKQSVERMLDILTEDSILLKSKKHDGSYKLKKLFCSIEEISKIMELQIQNSSSSVLHKEWQCASLFLNQLSEILRETKTAELILYPKKTSEFSAEKFYTESEFGKQTNALLKKAFEYLLEIRYKNKTTKDSPLRILEIGSSFCGTECMKSLVSLLEKHSIEFFYNFTDVSEDSVAEASSAFHEHAFRKNMEFGALKIEEDPKWQGFIPHEFDILIACNVLSSTKNLNQTAINVRSLTRESGTLLLIDTFRPQRFLDILFGQLSKNQSYTNAVLRPNSFTINNEQWRAILANAGYSETIVFEIFDGGAGLIVAEASINAPQYKLPTAVTTAIISKPKNWIIFSDRSELSNSVAQKLDLADRTVLTITQGDIYQKYDRLSFEIAPQSKNDIRTVIEYAISKFAENGIEGILYLWGNKKSSHDQIQTRSYLYLLQAIISRSYMEQPRIYVVTEGQIAFADQEPTLPNSSPLWGINRSFSNENPTYSVKTIDLDPSTNDEERKASEVFKELWTTDHDNLVSYRGGLKFVPRLQSLSENIGSVRSVSPLILPNGDTFKLLLPKTKAISDLKFVTAGKEYLQDFDVEIQIKVAGLNFKDIFNVIKPTAEFENSNSVAADFAGIVSAVGAKVRHRKVGDAVIGCNLNGGAMPSHTLLPEDHVVELPDIMTFAEGATLPCAFATAYHCLITVAQLKKGDIILIHTASGGVGLCAIQIAKDVGAKILATAGSQRKRAYLKNLGINYVYSSRDLRFGEEIIKDTKGVDVALNSLTGPGFKETSLKCCRENARFVEMSKLNVWSIEDVKRLRPDIKYSVEDLSIPDTKRWTALMNSLQTFLFQGKMQPLPFKAFSASNVRNALHYLEKAKQIGKVVCIMPHVVTLDGITELKSQLFNERSTYLIIGGTKGIGLEVAKWMVNSGAKYLVLCGRSPLNKESMQTVENMRNSGKKVTLKHVDISSYEQCASLLNSIKAGEHGLPPLRGIMHSAGCVADAIIPNQSWKNFKTTMSPKVDGAWNLHTLTINLNLEHFVMFSSFAGIIGSPGQSNYCASNAYLDALAQYRASIGLPALSINWGQWMEVGLAAQKAINGYTACTTAQGIRALEHLVESQLTQAIVCEGQINVWKSYSRWTALYLEELKNNLTVDNDVGSQAISSTKFWKDIESQMEMPKRLEIIMSYLSQLLLTLLKFKNDEKIEKHIEFQVLGLDSLMTMEFRNLVQRLLGSEVTISANDMADSNTLHKLTERVYRLMFDKNVGVDKLADRLERNKLVRDDSILWPHIQGDNNTVKPSEVQTVLLIGATGFLGSYVLRNLSQRQHIKKVYCLLREYKTEKLDERLVNQLRKMTILEEVDMSKVHLIRGDIAEIGIGLSNQQYESLSMEVEAVINCGVYSDHLSEYRKVETKQTNLRAVNVLGTQRILEFSASIRTKLVYQGSTILAAWKAEGDLVPEDWPMPGEYDEAPNFGYGISKYIGDMLVGQAATERQIPCKVFRFPKISGDSRTGRQFVTKNHFFMKFLQYIKSEVMPSFEIPMQLIPVDICADISLEVFFMDGIPSQLFNVFNPHSQNEKEITDVAKMFGHSVNSVEYEDFLNSLRKDGKDSFLFKWTEFYSKEDSLFRLHSKGEIPIPILKVWMNNPDSFFTQGKINAIIPNLKERIQKPTEILERDVKYAIEAYDEINL